MWWYVEMDSSWLWIIFYFYTVSCEWVEITPIINKKSEEVKRIIQTTTPDNYEVFMKTPSPKDYSFTTHVNYFTTQHEQENITFNSYNANTKFESTLETTPFSTTEAFPETSWAQRESDDLLEPSSNPSYEGFLPFLKIIQDKLFKYKSNSRKSKMSLLKHLRDQLLINIKERIKNLWKPVESSEARGYKDEDSHMDFPSNEGALMTIGFLTFAVFLIKLVIKLVHALKYKQQYYGMSTTTTASSVVFLKRKKREEINQEAAKILQYIDEF